MSWRDIFSLDTWFTGTAAAHGVRDAGRDYPREDTFIEVTTQVQPVANSTRFEPWRGEGQAAPTTLKLAPYEFAELKIAETKVDVICEGVERGRQHFETRLAQIHHHMQELHREGLQVRAAHATKQFGEPHPLMAKWLYVAIMIVMGAAELMFNATAFRLIEAGQDYQSYVMALAPTLSLLMMAHFLGVKWRQWSPQTLWRNLAIAGAIFVTITLAAWALGIMRAEFVEVKAAAASARAAAEALENTQDETASLERQVQELRAAPRTGREREAAREQLAAAEKALAATRAEQGALGDKAVAAKAMLGEARRGLIAPNLKHVWLLFAINMLILMTVAFASYYSHDADYELERIVRHKARLRRELVRAWRKWGVASARYDRIIKAARERINRVIHEFEAVVGEYRWYNTMGRSLYPSYFQTDFSGKPFLVRAFGHETEHAPEELREAFQQVERDLVDTGAGALTAVAGGKHA
jgi:hypothetical protein